MGLFLDALEEIETRTIAAVFVLTPVILAVAAIVGHITHPWYWSIAIVVGCAIIELLLLVILVIVTITFKPKILRALLFPVTVIPTLGYAYFFLV